MSRRARNPHGIRGPQSALTDFLASHNISARQIRETAEQRRQAATEANQQLVGEQENGDAEGETADAVPLEASLTVPAEEASPGPSTRGRRAAASNAENEQRKKEKDQKVIEKIKASKRFQKRKREADNSEDDDDLAYALYEQHVAPLPGQMENCEVCGKRFTVTPYSRSGPNGGLLCTPCGKELDKEAPVPKKKAKQATGGAVGRRRQMQSNILDGTFTMGGKTLATLCIETLAKNLDLAEDLGDLPGPVIDKIARKLSKHRLLNPTTLSLFLQPSADQVYIYDGAKLTTDDFFRIFRTVPGLKKLKVRNAIHFKDEVMDFLMSRHIELDDLYLHGSNLLSEEKWIEYLKTKGKPLQSLRVYWTDKHFSDKVLSVLPTACPSLTRLKVCHNQKVTGDGINHVSKISTLRHLSLDLRENIHPDIYVELVSKIGPDLRTLSLTRTEDGDNSILDALHTHCRSLEKLRITDSDVMTDAGFTRLFNNWANPGLVFLDLQKCRQLDSANPRQNPDLIGLCSNGFRALMAHSGKTLRHLNIHGCRHIEAAAFEEVFSADNVYEEMAKLEISFCEEVTDLVVGSIFRSCPNLRELNVFGCMKVKDVRVPRGKILVGVPNARGMVVEGVDDF